MMTVTVGSDLVRIIRNAYRANIPVLLHGRHGVGKSEILAQAASELGIDILVRDLSLMEPPDLIGIPQIEAGQTRYAPPSYLPTNGEGLLVFEELNRCARYMQAPTLQLLTARTLNDYALPPKWLPVAAINDAADGYHVDELDPALLSRFVRLRVEPCPEQWVQWAKKRGVHSSIVEFVAASPDIYEDAASNPRAWTYAGRLLTSWEADPKRSDEDLAVLLAGVLNDTWAAAFLATYLDQAKPLPAKEIVHDYTAWRGCVRRWANAGRLDLLRSTWTKLRRHLQSSRAYNAVAKTPEKRANVEAFFDDLPAELREDVREWLGDRGFDLDVAEAA